MGRTVFAPTKSTVCTRTNDAAYDAAVDATKGTNATRWSNATNASRPAYASWFKLTTWTENTARIFYGSQTFDASGSAINAWYATWCRNGSWIANASRIYDAPRTSHASRTAYAADANSISTKFRSASKHGCSLINRIVLQKNH